MKCKSCKKEIPEGSLYCMFCGERQIKERKKKAEVSVPKPRQLASGKYCAQLMVGGQRVYVDAATEKEYYTKARAIKIGLISAEAAPVSLALNAAALSFIEKRKGVLSPSTIRGYDTIVRTRFGAYMPLDIREIDYQQMISDEAAKDNIKAKTVVNAWGFIKSVLRENGVEIPKVTLPQIVPRELPWLEPEQIPLFLKAIKGKPVELAALLALHGLRRSELYALTPADISDGVIHVNGSVVRNINSDLVQKDTTKNVSSRRDVAIRIPRLQELLDADERSQDARYIDGYIDRIYNQVNAACDSAGLPRVGVHGLRRSFASLAYHLGWSEMTTMEEGGWSDRNTMNKKYIKLAKADAQKQGDSMTAYYRKLAAEESE